MKRILFRADAAPHIGIGDLMSLIHLSRYLDDSWEKYFIIRDYPAGVSLIEKYDVANTYIIDANVSVQEEVSYLNSFLKEHSIDIVFFEITERKLSDYEGLDCGVKRACVCFDGYIPDDMDLVVDWDVEARRYFDPAQHPDTVFLLGPEYVILPKTFYSDRIARRIYADKPRKLLIAMGGTDEFDFTAKVLQCIIKNNLDFEITVILGSGYANREVLEMMLEQSGVCYRIKQNITNMLDEYLACDVAIGAGGLTSSELVASFTPSILIATYEHQVARCKYFDSRGLTTYLGYRMFDADALISALQHPRVPKATDIFKTQAITEVLDGL